MTFNDGSLIKILKKATAIYKRPKFIEKTLYRFGRLFSTKVTVK